MVVPCQHDLTSFPVAAAGLKPGYGMYQTPSGFRALACAVNSYGSADFAYGVGVSPCRQCPTNMVTGPLASANPSVKNNDGDGFTSALACQTRPGYGWDGRVSTEVSLPHVSRAESTAACIQPLARSGILYDGKVACVNG